MNESEGEEVCYQQEEARTFPQGSRNDGCANSADERYSDKSKTVRTSDVLDFGTAMRKRSFKRAQCRRGFDSDRRE